MMRKSKNSVHNTIEISVYLFMRKTCISINHAELKSMEALHSVIRKIDYSLVLSVPFDQI